MFDTAIKIKIEVKNFLSLIKKYRDEQITCTKHTIFRLSEKQREIITCDELKRILLAERPFLVGLQYNNNYAIFYKYKNKTLKMIINIGNSRISIVTFYFINEKQIPEI